MTGYYQTHLLKEPCFYL